MSALPGFLDDIVRLRAREQPREPALRYLRPPHDGTTITWSELDRWADSCAAILARCGLGHGDRCAIQLTDSPACFAAIHGTFRRGAAVVMIDPRWGDASIRTVLHHADVRVVLVPDAAAAARFATLCDPGKAQVLGFPAPSAVDPTTGEAAAPPAPGARQPGDVALIAFTSGTTAMPKGVMLSHHSLLSGYAGARAHMPMAGRTRFGAVMRLGSIGVLGTSYFFPLTLGAHTIVLPELSLATASSFWETVERERIQFLFAVPALIHMLVRSKARPPSRPLDLLCATGAAPISSEDMQSFQAQFGVPLLNLFGLAETSFAVFLGDRDERGLGTSSIGRPLAIEARLLSTEGRVLDGAVEGRLQVRGPQLCLGYWRNPEATAQLFDDGWLDTGDIAFRDDQGRFFIHGRTKEVVMRGGYSIYLADVDEALLDHTAVQEASSVSIPDPLYGEAIVGFVRLADDAREVTAKALRAWCQDRLGSYRAPTTIYIVDQPLPRNALGKPVRRELLKWIP